MSDKKRKVPKLRFPGFTDAWEQRKLGDFSDITKLAGFEFTEHVQYSESGSIIALRGLNIKNGRLILDDVKYIDNSNFSKLNRSKLKEKDIMFTYVGTVGELAIIEENDKFYLAPNVSRIRILDGTSPLFLMQNMWRSDFYQSMISPLIATSSQPALSMDNIRKFLVSLPTVSEQACIGNFFSYFDSLISLHQRKLDNVKMLKKSLLQKLFPKDGEKIPELRFPGFTDAWEQRKLGEITSLITKGTTPKKQSWAGEVNFVKVENINEETNRIYPSARISLEEHQTYLKRSQLQDGDILFSIAGTLGRIGVVNSQILPANTNQAVAIVRVREGNLNYIKTVLQGNAIRDYIRQNPTVGAQPNLSLSQISEFKIGVPSLEEQVVIGDVFRHLTHFISLHQRKLDHLKELKKGLLQQMFV